MNSIPQALRAAGIPLPSVKYRIWNWLKDHPEKTADDIRTALGLAYLPRDSLLDMELCGVLKVFSDVSRKKGLKGVEYKIKRYSVTNTKEYAVATRSMAKPKLTITKKAQQAGPVSSIAPPTISTPTPQAGFDPETFLAGVSLQSCKALCMYLHGVFK